MDKPEEKKGDWTCTPGWCGYVKDKGREGNRPADYPNEKAVPKEQDGKVWDCNNGWCGYVEKQDHEGNRPADPVKEKDKG